MPYVDVVVLSPWFEDDGGTAVAGVDAATGGELPRAIASKEFRAGSTSSFSRHHRSSWKARRLALVGAGSGGFQRRPREESRRGGRTGGEAAACRPCGVRRSAPAPAPIEAAELASGARGRPDARRSSTAAATRPATPARQSRRRGRSCGGRRRSRVRVRGRRAGRLLGECSNLARELANEPGNTLTPREFARRAAAIAGEAGRRASRSSTKSRSQQLGMGLLLGVARGSGEPPRLMVFRHDPPGAPASPVLGLVGKGITFDTGGISIKPADGMERMKDDMAGGAAVVCAMRAIALLKAPMRVIGVVPTTENMPGGRAIKPGDILKSADGQDRRGHQHRRRRPADSRRRAVVRAAARRDAPGRRRHADRRRRRRARQDHERPVRHAATRGSSACAASPIAPAIASGRCRCSTNTAIRSRARSPTSRTPAAGRPDRSRRRCS